MSRRLPLFLFSCACGVIAPVRAIAQSWSLVAAPAIHPTTAENGFGGDVSLSEGQLLVGASSEKLANDAGVGAAYVLSGNDFANVEHLQSPDPGGSYYGFGSSVSLDGDRALIGAYRIDGGRAYFFERTNGSWQAVGKFAPDLNGGFSDGSAFGFAVALHGDHALVSAPKDKRDWGKLYAYTRVNGVWSETQQLYADDVYDGDFMGYDLDLDGDTAVLGAPGNAFYPTERAAAYVFRLHDGLWTQEARVSEQGVSPARYYGGRVAVHGDTIAVTAQPAAMETVKSKVFLYTRAGVTWTKLQELEATSEDSFGAPIALQGNTLWLGARTGTLSQIYVYKRVGDNYVESDRIDVSSGAGLARMDVLGGTLAVGLGSVLNDGGVRIYRNAELDPRDAGAADAAVSDAAVRADELRDANAPSATDSGVLANDGTVDAGADAAKHEAQDAATPIKKHSDGCSLAADADVSWTFALALASLLRRRKRAA